jgi:heme/copper-type cytochrome/quinol oxidase subunit 1
MSTGRRIGMALLITPIQTAGLNQIPLSLSAHGSAIWNTIRQVAGAVGTALLVTVMTTRSNTYLQNLMNNNDTNTEPPQQMITEASIQGVNDAYPVIIIIGLISLILSFFIKNKEQILEEENSLTLKNLEETKA